MARRSDWRRRWASLSALASAALAASSGSGEAAIIYHPTPGFGIPGSLPLPGGGNISFFTRYSRQVSNTRFTLGNIRGGARFSTYSGRVAARIAGGRFTGRGSALNIATRFYNRNLIVATAHFHSGSGKGVTRPLRFGSSSLVEHVLGRRYLTTSKGPKSTSVIFSASQHRTID